MIKNIKSWFFYNNFRLSNAKIHTPNAQINPLQTIDILFDGTSEDDRKTIHRFKKKIDPISHKSIRSLAFINNALPLDNVDYAAYNQKNVKWYGVPFGPKVEEFISYPTDLLIIMCTDMKPHFEYIIAHSQSKFKIGPSIKNAEKYLHLIISNGAYNNLEQLGNLIINGIEKISIK